MTNYTIQFRATTEVNDLIVEAMTWKADRLDPDNAPHSLNPAEVSQHLRDIAMEYIKSEVRSEIEDKARGAVSALSLDGLS